MDFKAAGQCDAVKRCQAVILRCVMDPSLKWPVLRKGEGRIPTEDHKGLSVGGCQWWGERASKQKKKCVGGSFQAVVEELR